MSEPPQEKPQPRGDRSPGVVVDDHLGDIVHPRLLHLVLDLPGGGQGVPTSTSRARHRLEVDEKGAGDVAAQIFLVALSVEQVPAKVDHRHVGIPNVFMQPGAAHQRPEAHPCTTRVSWQKWTSCGCISCSLCSESDQASRSAYCPFQLV